MKIQKKYGCQWQFDRCNPGIKWIILYLYNILTMLFSNIAHNLVDARSLKLIIPNADWS
jgi:hypothetical protein